MKILILLFFFSGNNPTEIALINTYKKNAEKSFLSNDFSNAASQYRFLIDSLQIDEDAIKLNLGHAYQQLGDTSSARTYYNQATLTNDHNLKSIAYQQLGVMSKASSNLNESLNYLKASIKANPSNTDARYDYELVKKLLEQRKDQNQSDQDENKEQQDQEQQDQEQQNQEQQDQEQQDQEQQDQEQQDQEQQDQDGDADEKKEQEQKEAADQQEKKPEEEAKDAESAQNEEEEKADENEQRNQDIEQKLQEMNISPEKAEMILEAMKNGEIQYIQQQKRKPTEKPDKGKPDW
jgi:Ca-activated chloride channel homolog